MKPKIIMKRPNGLNHNRREMNNLLVKKLRHLVREPLIHFLVIGAGLFLLFGLTQKPEGGEPNRIVVSSSQLTQLAANFQRTWLRPPTEKELAGLVKENSWPRCVEFAPGYAIGSLGAYWTIQRTVMMF